MELTFTPEQRALREEIRTWLAENIPDEIPPTDPPQEMRRFDAAWQRRQFEGGWAGIAWPQEYGGRGLGMVEQLIWYEEYARAGAPYIRSCFVAVNHGGPTLIMRGTKEQRARHLPRILSGDEIWCQGFSEPEAGSDLASIRTRATVDGGRLIVNGQKIWTSFAHVADFQELLVRTNPDAPRHKGLSWVVCDMKTPGIEVRPIESMDGARELCEVFYDNVEIPLENVVGGLDKGWQVAMTTLSFERGTAFIAECVALAQKVDKLIALAKEAKYGVRADGELAQRLARLRAEVTALHAMTYMAVSRNQRREIPGIEGSMLRLRVGELMQRVSEAALDVLGTDGLRWTPPLHHRGNWSNDYLFGFSRTISAGSKDIQRNIIGERLLGLPRS
jgi:alkylation response protein AidB-like acyl-CoA dehydrogenase